ncbi:glutaredoxin [Cucurbitaria berberidis CBS 394.84]|uniref:Glutaredoxin n=1 Tax=Cucurbitaria berberidis CBS 394.84 TaxID=1168544 RepID=A0A9P4L8V2_9PLEO|nr:glutaredoxin [Cucurbitaria berberidis CBS 394.84]KAF1846501.1 glutaredoxin [Cucurbitaria berberidis CBS 394.84]
MPSQRRMRLIAVLALITIIVIVYISRGAHQTHGSDFYTKTQQALQESQFQEAAKQRDADGVGSRLKAAEDQAKKAADEKYDSKKVAIEGDDQKGVAGRVKLGGDKVPGVAAQGGRSRDQAIVKEDETPEAHEVETELNLILKKSPMIIFSKSYCPYSKKAKHILLEKYRILPEPYVVELDLHPLGEKLQALLAKSTGRRTVPNILLLGKSLGGGDDMEELDETETLVAKIKEMGGSRITEVEHRGARPETSHRQARRS